MNTPSLHTHAYNNGINLSLSSLLLQTTSDSPVVVIQQTPNMNGEMFYLLSLAQMTQKSGNDCALDGDVLKLSLAVSTRASERGMGKAKLSKAEF